MKTITIPKRSVSLEKLGLINEGLFQVDGELAERYNGVLKVVFDFDSELDSFRVDKRGLSLEVGEHLTDKYPERLEYPENYLNIRSANRYMIIVSPDQKNSPLVATQTSYDDDFFSLVHEQARHTIEEVTQDEVLYGEIDNGIDIYTRPEDLLNVKIIKLTLETQRRTVQLTDELKRLSDELDEENNALDEDYLKHMRSLVRIVGDIRYRMISPDIFPIKRELSSFYSEFFNGIHCLRNFRSKDGTKTIFINDGYDIDSKNLGGDFLALDTFDKELIDTLYGHGFIKYNKDLIEQRLTEIEDTFFLDEKLDVVEMTTEERKRKISEMHDQFPNVWEELREVKNQINSGMSITKSIKDRGYNVKLKLSEPRKKKKVLEHLLAMIDPTDVVRSYEHNRRKLLDDFTKMGVNRKRYVAYKLLKHKEAKK